MANPRPPDPTRAYAPQSDRPEAGSPAAPGPDRELPSPATAWQALSASLSGVPRVLLGDPHEELTAPIVQPDSHEMPTCDERSSVRGRYQLLGEIARGGMGAVLKGRDAHIGRDIAVKVLLETHMGRAELAQRFVEEAQITGQLQHPGITPVYELGLFADQRPYFTMKLVKGKTLAALLLERRQPAADGPRYVTIFEQVCQTLAYAHARGVIHRDLKPSNVMVGAFGEVQVMDWGLAKVLKKGGVADETKPRRQADATVIHTERSLEGDSKVGTHTIAGSVLGTPAYMAPEQARGDLELIDERTDVFGLGAILCEILTGQPPYVGEGAQVRRLAQGGKLQETFARLDGCGADPELIALGKRCLAPEPWDRPRDGGEVAAAVTRHQQSVAERLRQAELARAAEQARALEARATADQERLAKEHAQGRAAAERRSRRLTLALTSTALIVLGVGGATAAWWWQERSATSKEVELALAQATGHRQASRWPEAEAALQRAEARIAGFAAPALRDRVRQARADADMVGRLEDIRLRHNQVYKGAGLFDLSGADHQFSAAFRDYGIDPEEQPLAEAAPRVRSSAIHESLLAALDNWMRVRPAQKRSRLRVVADAADGNAWRKELRAALVATDAQKLHTMALKSETLEQSPGMLVWLSDGLNDAGLVDDSIRVLQQAQQRYPGDFWINFALGLRLYWSAEPSRPSEAIAFYRIALALRPANAVVHSCLGAALQTMGDLDAAMVEVRRAIELDPNLGAAHINLALCLGKRNRVDAEIAELRKALDVDPANGTAHVDLGVILSQRGDRRGAIVEFRNAIRADPSKGWFHANLVAALWDTNDVPGAFAECRAALLLVPARETWTVLDALATKAQLEDVRAIWEAALARRTREHDAWYGYAELCLLLGEYAAYRRARIDMLDIFRDTTEPTVAERVARACLLLPPSREELNQAEALVDRALTLGREHRFSRYFRFAKALAEYRRNRPDQVLAFLQDTEIPVGLSTNLVAALALARQGTHEAARTMFRKALTGYDWTTPRGLDVDHWIRQILRREAETAVVPQLPAFLEGKYRPSDLEQWGLIQLALWARGENATMARRYAETFAGSPALADEASGALRYNAACSAALAGAGVGREAANLAEKERARWRHQALTWLRAELTACSKRVQKKGFQATTDVCQQLQHWKTDPDLAGIRDERAVARLPAAQQRACRQLWVDVDALLENANR